MERFVEVVARAICRTTFEGLDGADLDAQVEQCWHVWEDAARAAIDAYIDEDIGPDAPLGPFGFDGPPTEPGYYRAALTEELERTGYDPD